MNTWMIVIACLTAASLVFLLVLVSLLYLMMLQHREELP